MVILGLLIVPRILSLLYEKEEWSTEELQTVQTDVKLWSAEIMKQTACKLLKNRSTSFTEIERIAYEALKNWNGVMETSSIGTSVFMVTNYHVMKYMLKEKLDEEFIKLYLNRIDHWDFKEFLLEGTVPFKMQETPEDILYAGFKLAINELSSSHGDIKIGNGAICTYIIFEHPLESKNHSMRYLT